MTLMIGNYSLLIGIASLLIGLFHIIKSILISNDSYYILGRNRLLLINSVNFISITISITCLLYNYIISNFYAVNVLEFSHSSEPLIYKVAGMWGNHEGSMLCWCWLLSLYSFLFVLFSEYFYNKVLFNSLLITFFLIMFLNIFTYYTSNPFLQLNFLILDGSELNPILQDPGLIFHPPFLYMGYVGFSIVFCIVMSLCIKDNFKIYYIKYIKIWILYSWTFLTIGITLGSWWAYYELGWGGWWFWDPVENASLMPWILGVALIHTIKQCEQFKVINKLTILLVILSFLSSLIGTFFVRSGLLNSVHTFANDSSKGIFLIIFIIIITVYSLWVFFNYKYTTLNININPSTLSKNTGMIISIILILGFYLTILFGSFSGVLFKILFNKDISIGSPYFNNILISLLFPFLVLMIVTPYFKWGSYKKNIIDRKSILFFSIYSLFITVLLGIFCNIKSVSCIVITSLSIFLLISIVYDMIKFRKLKNFTLPHISFALLTLAICLSTYLETEFIISIQPGNIIYMDGYKYVFRDLNYTEGINYNSLYADIVVLGEHNQFLNVFFPEKRLYFINEIYSTKASIYSNLINDVYIMIGDGNLNQGWYLRFFYNPLIIYLWLSSLSVIVSNIILAYRIYKSNRMIIHPY